MLSRITGGTLILYAMPIIILYYVVKLAVKHAIKELKKEGVI
ncbi:hypothetical protein OXPF_11260 [Oxobacter pfennigii]|uniref:Uncharacterized protein n=1 Tax=Oxobacter pfennigii TaxID=36849 RepID=A0A0P9AIE5_9CLOT|nr:hypothetical protein [Oxobacter pfennigii]KPU45235.1 hypothetical protein OXPF_11260 [Oxobacter pfennigii]